jgi:Ca2+-binding EF-hand superfamily protein
MGNEISSSGASRMAIAAMANVTSLEKRELQSMQRAFMEISQRQGNPNTVAKDEFQEALEGCGITEADNEILDRLFIMLDKTGDQQINYREFLCGIAPLVTGDVKEKLNFSFELYDVDGAGVVKKAEMTFVMRAMNDVSSYFGDPVMSQDQIQVLVDEIYEKFDDEENPQGLNYKDFMNAVTQHPVLVSFVKGEGPVRYGQSK